MPYAIYWSGQSIFGVGATLDDALNEAERWIDPQIDGEDWRDRLHICTVDSGAGEIAGHLYARPCTPRVFREVSAHGGDCVYALNAEGLLDLTD
jgi:hypothetical protein